MVPTEGVALTKDNLLKRNWKGDSRCCFCKCNETIQHHFFYCHVAKIVWGSVWMVFGIQPPSSVTNLLGAWLRSFPVKLKRQLLVGAVALCWEIWLCRNDAIFCRTTPNSYLQVIFRGTFWAWRWSQLSKEEKENFIAKVSGKLEGVMLEFFYQEWLEL